MVEGEENIGWARRDELSAGEYNEKDDFELLDGETNLIKLTKGSFMVVFPQDAHTPLVVTACCKKVKKLVVKFMIYIIMTLIFKPFSMSAD